MQFTSSRSLSVAGFVLAGIAALLILAVKVGNMRLAPVPRTYSVLAEFHDADSLQVGAPVASAGVQVGTVSAIAFDQRRYEARVKLAIDSRYRFPADTSAAVLTQVLLGNQYVELEPGADSASLEDGGTIKTTRSALEWEQLLRRLMRAADRAP